MIVDSNRIVLLFDSIALQYIQYSPETQLTLFKVNNKNTRKRCEIYSKLTLNTPERQSLLRCGVFIVNFEQVKVRLEGYRSLNIKEHLAGNRRDS